MITYSTTTILTLPVTVIKWSCGSLIRAKKIPVFAGKGGEGASSSPLWAEGNSSTGLENSILKSKQDFGMKCLQYGAFGASPQKWGNPLTSGSWLQMPHALNALCNILLGFWEERFHSASLQKLSSLQHIWIGSFSLSPQEAKGRASSRQETMVGDLSSSRFNVLESQLVGKTKLKQKNRCLT